MSKLPGGALASRPLHFVWIADCSGSMGLDGKIQALNNAIREAIPHMQQVAAENPNAQVLVRAVAFSDGARWHLAQPTPVADFRWQDLKAGGVTDMGQAMKLLAEQLQPETMPARALPPVLVLISDGQPTDKFDTGLQALMEQPWGKKAVRIAIAIGDDADLNVLQKFIGHPEFSRSGQQRHASCAASNGPRPGIKSASSPPAGSRWRVRSQRAAARCAE